MDRETTTAPLSSDTPAGIDVPAARASDRDAMPPGGEELAAPKGLSSFALKIAAILAMTCNHAGYIFYGHLPFGLRCALIAIGGLTFPIMAYLLVEGYVHTSSLRRYALRLAVFALVAEAPFWLFLGHKGNVLFTLLGGLGVLWAVDNIENDALRPCAVLAITLVSWACDWGAVGPVLVLLFYMLRERRGGIALAMLLPIAVGMSGTLGHFLGALEEGSWRNLPFVLYYALGNTAAAALLSTYNGQRGGRPMKWLFYVYYPAHIAVLGIAYVLAFGEFPSLMVG